MAVLDTARSHEKPKRLLRSIFHEGPIGRLQLARLFRIGSSVACNIAQQMLGRKLILEELIGNTRRRRQPDQRNQ